jgi:hypothetical protein
MNDTDASPNDPTEAARRLALGRMLPLWPAEIADTSLAGQERICRLLASALRRERQRGVGGHWTYDVARHAALARALRPELRRLARLRPKMKMPAGKAGIEGAGART